MSDKISLTEYQVSEAIHRVSYFSSAQKQLVKAALAIYTHKHSGLDEGGVKELLRDLHNAGLISSGGVDSVMKKIFSE